MADSLAIIPFPTPNENIEVETSPQVVLMTQQQQLRGVIQRFIAMSDIGYCSEEEMKVLMGPGTKTGIYLRTAQIASMVVALVTCFFIHSFFMFTNNRLFISGIATNLLLSLLCLIHDFNAMTSVGENAISRVAILLIGNLIAEWFLLFAISVGASSFFFLLVDEGFYNQFRGHSSHMTAAVIVISSLGWLCTLISTMVFLSIVARSKNRLE